ncbi:MAG: class I SAM-dependent methyltransferase [Vicinamibacterales bacterium]
MTAYDEVPYACRPIPCTAPEQLAMASLLHGGPCPAFEGARFLEIGCGDGANLLPLAFFRPDCEFVGVDASAVQIADARRSVERLTLHNITLHADDICELGPTLGRFDYIVAHGVISWVSDIVRDGILDFCREHLADDGLLYLSYNTHPGWLIRGVVRSSMVGPRGSGESLRQMADEARRRAAALRKEVENVPHPYAQLLSRELAYAEAAEESSVVHDYLADHNRAYWFRELASLATGFGFRYLTEAPFTQPDYRVPPALREAARTLTSDPIMMEELIDVLWYRQHRSSLFCRHTAPSASASGDLPFDRISVAAAVRPRSEAVQLTPGVDETFDGLLEPDVAIALGDPLGKATLATLAAIWPRGLGWRQLVAQSIERVRASGLDVPDDAVADLQAQLLSLNAMGQVNLRLRDLPLSQASSERPAVAALTRWEAERRSLMTTPTHQRVSLASIDRLIVEHLTGAHTPAEIVAAVVAKLQPPESSRESEVLRAVAELPESTTPEQWVASRLAYDLGFLGSWGLLR